VITTAVIIPPETAWMGVPWYARPEHAKMNNLDSEELAFAITWSVVWIIGLIVFGVSALAEKSRGRRKR